MNIKIFKVNDCDWAAAETVEDAITECLTWTGQTREEYDEEDACVQLTEIQLNSHIYTDGDEFDQDGEPVRRTFRSQLKRMIERGEKFPCMFASTEF